MRKLAEKFCTMENESHKRKPWTKVGKTYATDCSAAIEIVGEFGEPMQDGKKYPDIFRVMDDIKVSGEIPIPEELPEIKVECCSTCSGSGFVALCDACDGEGVHECDCGYTHDCKKCDGLGHQETTSEDEDWTYCPDCEGTGKVRTDNFPVDLGPFKLQAKYLILASELPGAKTIKYESDVKPVLVEFKGGRAAFMPMKY